MMHVTSLQQKNMSFTHFMIKFVLTFKLKKEFQLVLSSQMTIRAYI
jgi:hypothetical protein